MDAPLKQLVIVSGKGGTGKTSLAAAFSHLAYTNSPTIKAVIADVDVDAANLGLLLHPQRIETHDFIGGSIGVIESNRCQGCGICEQICRFDAIQQVNGAYSIDPMACDGCAACVYQCPEGAVVMHPQIVGQWYRSETHLGPLFHADLHPGKENSGKLVTLARQNARLLAMDENYQMIIIDGPPGIGCPVISAVAGADMVLVVAEPTAAGIHDMERVLQLASHFCIPAVVCINKADVYPAGSDQIINYCNQHEIEVIGQIRYDESVIRAVIDGEPVTAQFPEAPASQVIRHIWLSVISQMGLIHVL